MYELRQFKPTLYIFLMLGISGFALAAQLPGLWLLAAMAVGINAWLMFTGRFVPMPAWLAAIVSIVGLLVLLAVLQGGDTAPIMAIGQLLVILQLIKLFEQRTNRDYAQMIVLSLLLIVAAAISTSELLFFVIAFAYFLVAFYCCLLFHLKWESEKAETDPHQEKPRNAVIAAQRVESELSRSIRRLTGVMATVSLAAAVLIFIFFPRGGGQGLFALKQIRPSQTMTGFNDRVSFQKVAQIERSEDVIARVELYQNDHPVTDAGVLLLRGSALDQYAGNTPGEEKWSWSRSPDPKAQSLNMDAGDTRSLGIGLDGPNSIRQVITLQPTGTNKLFAMAGPTSITTPHAMMVFYSVRDGVMQSREPLRQTVKYTVVSSGEMPLPDTPEAIDAARHTGAGSVIDPAITQFAQRPEVCGVDAAGKPLAQYPRSGDHTQDGKIVENFNHYLQTNYRYALDLTNIAKIGNRDPIVAFLTDFKQGHCEYFAGAMTLMCQSIGIPARLIVGFRCTSEDFNTIGNYYLVRQSAAHAWCEALITDHWVTLDPTSSGDVQLGQQQSAFAPVGQLFDFLEYKWANSVVAYDQDQRDDLVDSVGDSVSSAAVSGTQRIFAWWDRFEYAISSTLLSIAINSMIALVMLAVAWFFWDRWKFRRKVRRLGANHLPIEKQVHLVRQAGFYSDLIRVLSRRRILRPPQWTPLEFSRSLTFLPGDLYRDVERVTDYYYRVRFGGVDLPPRRRKYLTAVVRRIRRDLRASHLPRRIIPIA